MPGIITHNRNLIESINYLKKKKKVYPVTRSVESLFQNANFKRAALFGSIGPNIFDYFPIRKNSLFGSELSYIIHNSGSYNVILAMLKRLFKLTDHNNEWASVQRAYLYGFISHIVSDSVFHPFVFYWSGFPTIYKKDEVHHYREQNLLFQYNMDIYFLYYYNHENYAFSLENMLPLYKRGRLLRTDRAIKEYLLGSIMDSYPEIFRKIIFKKGKKGDSYLTNSFGYIDLVPYFIRLAYFIKKNKNQYFIKFIESIKRNKIFFSDFIVRYPEPRKMNKHVLNLHRERWYYPAGAPGLHYESVDDLMKMSRDMTVAIWESIESMLHSKTPDLDSVLRSFNLNTLTGEEQRNYNNMNVMKPIRLRF
jgi:hypothetical protein